uniref:Uncharacterized protein n=1 Tax=Ditylum brightwellii TaxID=49249 RepID=A0A7S1YY83_9STRA
MFTNSQIQRPVAITSLKQRTSSTCKKKDYSNQTLFSLLKLVKLREYFITVDNFRIWRRHLAWSKLNGADLRNHLTQRFASSMVFMSLLLGAELNVLFNSSHVTSQMRQDMSNENTGSLLFWIGITIIVSAVLTLLTLITTFTAWGMVSSISDNNSHCVLRSSIGQYVVHLPAKLIVAAIYAFLLWIVLWLFVLLPGIWPYVLLLFLAIMFFHVVITFSAFGRLIMHSGAMGTERIFDQAFEQDLLPHGLHSSLLIEAQVNLEENKSITRQYRRNSKENLFSPDPNFESSKSNGLSNRSGRGSDRGSDRGSFSDSIDGSERSVSSTFGWLNKNGGNGGNSESIRTPGKQRKSTSGGNVLPTPSLLNSANHTGKSMKRLSDLSDLRSSSSAESSNDMTTPQLPKVTKAPGNFRKTPTPEEVRRQRKVSWDNVGMEKVLSETYASPLEGITPTTSNKRQSPQSELGSIREPDTEWTDNIIDPELGEIGVRNDFDGKKYKNVNLLNEEIDAEGWRSGSLPFKENGDETSEFQHLLSDREGIIRFNYSTRSETGQPEQS